MLKITDVLLTPQTVNTGQNILIQVSVKDVTWQDIKDKFNWDVIKAEFANWGSVKNYIP